MLSSGFIATYLQTRLGALAQSSTHSKQLSSLMVVHAKKTVPLSLVHLLAHS